MLIKSPIKVYLTDRNESLLTKYILDF